MICRHPSRIHAAAASRAGGPPHADGVARRSGREIRASALVAAPPAEVFEFLADLRNHWLLADRFIEVLTLDCGPDGRCVGGRVRIRAPLGLRRTAWTQVLAADPPHQMIGTAEVGARTRACVAWKLTARPPASRICLEATIDHAGVLDRLLLMVDGRRWLERRFASVLQRLTEKLAGPHHTGRVLRRGVRRSLTRQRRLTASPARHTH